MSAERRPSELARLSEVRRVGTERAGEIGALLSDAFADDPLFAWLLAGADAGERAQRLDTWWRFMLLHPPPGAEMHVSGDGAAAAVWHPPGCKPHPPGIVADFGRLVENLLAERAPGALASFARFARSAPATEHWHLAAVGVSADRQGQGLGARLLTPMLARCDRLDVPAYLESSNPRNLAFYDRLGFRPIDEVETVDGAATLTLMWRRPRASR